jgi:gliding motility-associated-like protein
MPNYLHPLIYLFIGLNFSVFSQGCDNTDFSEGTFNHWETFTGYCCGAAISTPGTINGRHTIITTSTLDPWTNNTISTMPPTGGGAYSIRLGNDNVGSEAERIQKSFTVSEENKFFIYQYALVLQDPSGHDPIDKPKFEVRIFDENNNIVLPEECGYYQVTAGPETDTWGINDEVRYKDWATVGLDLSNYLNTTVTVEFTVQDCGLGGHFGYAYIDAACGFLDIKVIGFCEGSDEVTLIAPDGFTGYYWPHSGETTQTVVIPIPEEGDSVIVQVENEAGCATSILHIFEELPLPYAEAGSDTNICLGEQLQLWSNGAGENGHYDWYANGQLIESTQFLYITPTESTTYTLYASNANGCFSDDSSAIVQVNVNTDLFFELPNDTTLCSSSSLNLNCTAIADEYNWYSSLDSIPDTTSSITVTPIETTTYYCAISNGFCSYIDSITITVQDSESFPDTSILYYCEGATELEIIPIYYFNNYLWGDGTTGSSTTVTIADTQQISLTFETIYGCFDSIIYLIDVEYFPTPAIFTMDDTLCISEYANIIATGNPNGNYQWTSSPAGYTSYSASLWVSPIQATSYIVQAISENGCTGPNSYDTVLISVDSSAYFELTSLYTICEGDSVTLEAGELLGTCSWTSLGAEISTNDSVTVAPTFSQYYYLTHNIGNCSYNDYTQVNVISVNTYNEVAEMCDTENSISISAPVSAYVDYFWPDFGNNNTSNTVNNPTEGQIVPIYCTTAAGCIDTMKYLIHKIEQSILNPFVTDSICAGDNLTVIPSSTGSDDIYTWVAPGINLVGPSLFLTPTENTLITVSLSNPLNCVGIPNEQTYSVIVTTPPAANIPASSEICYGDTISLSSTNLVGDAYWTYEGTDYLSNSITVSPTQNSTATYTISYGPCLNSYSSDIIVNQTNSYQIVVGPSSDVCEGEEFTLSLTPSSYNSVTWSTSNQALGNTDNLTITASENETYTANINDENDCPSQVSQLISVHKVPEITMVSNVEVCNNTSYTISPQTDEIGLNYYWSTGEESTSIDVTQTGTYWVTVSNANCSTTDSIDITFSAVSFIGEIPNVFTPNGDGINDEFFIDQSYLSAFHLKIIDRWGGLVFTTDNPTNYWDGTKNGTKVEDGVYFYILSYESTCDDLGSKEVKGNITVFGH